MMGALWVSAIMPKLLKVSKMVNIPSREVKVVSNYRFSGSKNLFLAIYFMYEEKKTLMGALWASAIMLKLLKLSITVK